MNPLLYIIAISAIAMLILIVYYCIYCQWHSWKGSPSHVRESAGMPIKIQASQCPVKAGTRITVKLQDGFQFSTNKPELLHWDIDPHVNNIVAWRLCSLFD
jgi:hypothetical protein